VSTAKALAEGLRYYAGSPDVTVLGTGAGSPWGVLAAEQGRVMLLNGATSLSATNAGWLRSIRSGLRVVMAGDGAALSQDVSVGLVDAVR
jgi:hypothetical protein